MNLQAKLTLGYVLLAVVIVGIISGVDLGNNMQQQFEATLERAEIIKPVATKFVSETLELAAHHAACAKRCATTSLADDLLDLRDASNAILEIAVVDPQPNEVLADSDPIASARPPALIPTFATW